MKLPQDMTAFETAIYERLMTEAGVPGPRAYTLVMQNRKSIDDAVKRALDKEVERILDTFD